MPTSPRRGDELEDETPEDKPRRGQEYIPTAQKTEQALLIAVESPSQAWDATESLEELARLAESVDVEVIGSV